MEVSHINVEWLKQVKYQIKEQTRGGTINGVIVKDLTVNLDGRGEVTELWSKPWLEKGLSNVEHIYQSTTDFGVTKCWHLHQMHTDQFVVTRGKLQVTLVDLREESTSFGHVNVFFLGTLRPRILKIPPMIMHGWKALSFPEVIVLNLQTHVYNKNDEYKYPWNCVLMDIWEPHNG